MAGQRLLTEAEVEALPAGTRVGVIWSGGNGPHVYYVHKDRFGHTLLGSLRPGEVGADYRHSLPCYIGAHPLTQIWLHETADAPVVG